MISLFEIFLDHLTRFGLEYFKLYYAEYDAVCMDNKDPEEQGRIIVKVPQVGGNKSLGNWAWPKPVWSGRNSGMFIVPDVNDPVIVTFRNGNPSYPRYSGGSWPKVDGTDNFTPTGAYVNGSPVVRLFRTKSGHEISFCDDPENRNCKFIWHNPDGDKYSFITFTKDGNIQMATHKGSFMEMRAVDDDDLNMLVDSRGSSIIQDKDGIKIIDSTGNVVELKKDTVQIIGTKDVIVNSQAVNMKTGSVVLGDNAMQDAVRGTSMFQWLTTVLLPHYLGHFHPTGVGPSGTLTPPPVQMPIQTDILTNKVKLP